MKQFLNQIRLTTLAVAVLLAAGCTQEPPTDGIGEGTLLRLSIDGMKATQGSTTRAVAVNESTVSNLWVLQFQMTQGSTTEVRW